MAGYRNRTRDLVVVRAGPDRGTHGWYSIASFGPGPEMQIEGRVAAWEPPHRIVFDKGEDRGGLALEWLIEARDGGTCVVRLVNNACPTRRQGSSASGRDRSRSRRDTPDLAAGPTGSRYRVCCGGRTRRSVRCFDLVLPLRQRRRKDRNPRRTALATMAHRQRRRRRCLGRRGLAGSSY